MASSLTMNSVRNVAKLLRNISASRVCRHCSSLHTADVPGRKFLLAAAVCVERHPVITRDKTEFFNKFKDTLDSIELEKSSLSDYELQIIKEEEKARKALEELDEEKDTKLSNSKASKEEVKISIKDLEYMWEEELRKMELADRNTANANNDMKSLYRHLDRKLILLVKHTIGDTGHWMLPQSVRDDHETLRETAERTLKNRCGNNLQSDIIGNAPCGHYIQTFPRKIQLLEGVTGVKVYFFKTRYKKGQVELDNKDIKDYIWVTLDELPDYVETKLGKRLSKFILESPHL